MNTTQNALRDWAFGVVLSQVNQEARKLLNPSLSLVRGSKEALTWDRIVSFSMGDAKEAISFTAPMTFALLSTLATSQETCKTYAAIITSQALGERTGSNGCSFTPESAPMDVEEEGEHRSAADSALDVELEGSSDEIPSGTPGVPDGMQRDPWLVSCLLFDSNIHSIE